MITLAITRATLIISPQRCFLTTVFLLWGGDDTGTKKSISAKAGSEGGRETALCEMRQCLFVFPPSSNDNWQRGSHVGDDLSPIHAKFMFICVAPRQILPLARSSTLHPFCFVEQAEEYLRMPSITLDRFSRRQHGLCQKLGLCHEKQQF